MLNIMLNILNSLSIFDVIMALTFVLIPTHVKVRRKDDIPIVTNMVNSSRMICVGSGFFGIFNLALGIFAIITNKFFSNDILIFSFANIVLFITAIFMEGNLRRKSSKSK